MPFCRFLYTLCGLLAAVSLSCSRSSPSTTPPVAPRDAGSQRPARATEEQAFSTPSPELRGAAGVAEPTSAEPSDAEDVLKIALARARDPEKLLLVHLGSPG